MQTFAKACLLVSASALAACGTVIDFGPEPGTVGDEAHLHFQPELHGPGGKREQQAAAERGATPATAPRSTPAETGAMPAPAPPPVLPPPPPPPATPPAPTSEAMFNDAIRRAVEAGDIDRALRLLEEAERLGSQSARPTFIEAIGARGD